jgi:hypothetical protein
MARWPRRLIFIVAILSIALAACFVPPVAHSAMHHDDNPAHSQNEGHGQHHSGSPDCHEPNDSSAPHDGGAARANPCCTAACGASAFIWPTPAFPERDRLASPAVSSAHMLHTLGRSLIDPPPRAC